jgi:hypothetical protein
MSSPAYTLPTDDWLSQHLREYRDVLAQIALDDRPRFDGLLEAAVQQLEWAVALASGDTVPADPA